MKAIESVVLAALFALFASLAVHSFRDGAFFGGFFCAAIALMMFHDIWVSD